MAVNPKGDSLPAGSAEIPCRPMDMAEHARRLREAGEMLRERYPDHAAACIFAAAILEGGVGLDDFRR
jgi:hypothetical protein